MSEFVDIIFNKISDIETKDFSQEFDKIIQNNPCLLKTDYGTNKLYMQERFYISKSQNKPFTDCVKDANAMSKAKKKSFIKRAIRKAFRILKRLFNKITKRG